MSASAAYLEKLGHPATIQKYHEKYLDVESEADLLGVVRAFRDPKQDIGSEPALVLNETLFHAQGGGQPSDSGVITVLNDDGSESDAKFEVNFVKRIPDGGLILHMGSFAAGSEASFTPGARVRLAIDAEKRSLHSKLHSAGHALDAAMCKLKDAGNAYAAALIPTKGYHFPDAPRYVSLPPSYTHTTTSCVC